MNGFAIRKADGTAAFELEIFKIWDIYDIDATVTVKYDYHHRSILSHNHWSFCTAFLSDFRDNLSAIHKTMKGQAKLSSLDNDELLLNINGGVVQVEITDSTPYDDGNGMVRLSFHIDQSYLPEIINQLDDCIQSIREVCQVEKKKRKFHIFDKLKSAVQKPKQ